MMIQVEQTPKFIPSVIREELRAKVKNRHHYLKLAMRHLKLNQIGDMHIFCSLAEREQRAIESFGFSGLENNILRP